MAGMSDLKARLNGGKGRQFIHHTPLNMLEPFDMKSVNIRGKRYYVTPEGLMPSMTTFLKHFDTSDWKEKWIANVGIAKATAEGIRTRARGTQIHAALESYLKNEPNAELKAGQYRRMYNQIRGVLGKRLDKVICLEQALYSKTLRIAGRGDMLGVFDGTMSFVDYKNSNRLKKKEDILDYFLQTTGYSLMAQEQYGIVAKQLVILNSVEGGERDQCQVLIAQRDEFIPEMKRRVLLARDSELYQNLVPDEDQGQDT